MPDVPPGFEPLFRTSPFLVTMGPVFYRRNPGGLVIGLRVLDKHTNARGAAHGGLLMTLADIALGYNAALAQDPPLSLTTASVSTDFSGSAHVGDWLEVHVDLQKVGRRLAFANAFIFVGSERIARASAVFARNDAPAGRDPG